MNGDRCTPYYDPPIEPHETLSRVNVKSEASPDPSPSPTPQPPNLDRASRSITPSRQAIIRQLDRNYVCVGRSTSPPTSDSTGMTEPIDVEVPSTADSRPTAVESTSSKSDGTDPDAARPAASSRTQTSLVDDTTENTHELTAVQSIDSHIKCQDISNRSRVDSALDNVQQPFSAQSEPREADALQPPATIEPAIKQEITLGVDDRSSMSPHTRKHPLRISRDSSSILPPLETTTLAAQQDGSASSPKSERLPSLNHLYELAGAAMQAPHVQHHSQKPSFCSIASQSPLLPHHPLAGSAVTSPISIYHSTHVPSPTTTSTMSVPYGSPQQLSGPQPYYAARRPSMSAAGLPLHPPPSLQSASSSSEGYHGSSSEGYSTSHTTPTDPPCPAESAGHRDLPRVQGMPMPPPMNIPGPYVCNDPGCAGVTFQTQYLLNSHKNVHSQNRPHYCPVPECSRSVGGKGFKRKNEMIRHGLVHNSPGYVCPFCPEREHKYPRPDNLQRHVRVHHPDKSKDDPILQDVLSQRSEGSGKQRRRRTHQMLPVA